MHFNLALVDGGKLKCNDYLSNLQEEQLDYIISVQYDEILKSNVINTPKELCLNLHFSPLPKLRGCYPTKWAIIEEMFSGVTLHEIDQGIDTGDVFAQTKTKLSDKETDQTLYLRLAKEADHLFASNLNFIKERKFPKRSPQLEQTATYHPKKLPYDGQLDWNNSIDFCDKLLRAFTFPPFPPVSCVLGNRQIGLHCPIKKEALTSQGSPGDFHVNGNGTLSIQCTDGKLTFDRIWYQNQTMAASMFDRIPEIQSQ